MPITMKTDHFPCLLSARVGLASAGFKFFRAIGLWTLAACLSAAHADFPERPIRLVVPFTPSGAVDGIARLTAIEFGKALGQTVIVENKPGSGGTIGINFAGAAAADGYTMLLGNIALAAAPALYPKSGINPQQFAPVALIGRSAYILAVKNDFPATTVAELVALAKANPGKYNYASAGAGSAIHLAAELFKSKAAIDVVHVPYKGAGPALNALMAGEVEMMFGSVSEMKSQIAGKRFRVLAVTSSKRMQALPQLPTLAEGGIRDYEVAGWYGLYVPAKTPPEVLKKLQTAAAVAFKTVAMQQRLATYEMEPATGGAVEAGEVLESETKRWSEIIRNAGIKVE